MLFWVGHPNYLYDLPKNERKNSYIFSYITRGIKNLGSFSCSINCWVRQCCGIMKASWKTSAGIKEQQVSSIYCLLVNWLFFLSVVVINFLSVCWLKTFKWASSIAPTAWGFFQLVVFLNVTIALAVPLWVLRNLIKHFDARPNSMQQLF